MLIGRDYCNCLQQTLRVTEVYSVSVTSLSGFDSRAELSGKLNCFSLIPSTLWEDILLADML